MADKLPFTHDHVWRAIDALAKRAGWSASHLAVASGLDATAFNPSKRRSPLSGKPRWPSLETLAKVLAATDTTFTGFATMIAGFVRSRPQTAERVAAWKNSRRVKDAA